jgi:hypothetical protein
MRHIISEEFSFHTLELSKKLTNLEYWKIRNTLFDESAGNYRIYHETEYSLVCEKYKHNGIILKLRRKHTHCHLIIRVNPRRISGDQEYIGIFEMSEQNLDYFLDSLQTVLTELSLGDRDEFILRRLDLCRNVSLSRYEEVEDYMTLMARAKQTHPFRKEFYNVDGKRSKSGITFKSKDYEVYVYDKHVQMKTENLINEETEGYNVIRFEIKLARGKIRRIFENLPQLSLREALCLVSDISRQQFAYHIPRLFLEGNYYQLEQGREVIANSSFGVKAKEKMLAILEESAKRQDLQIALSEIRSHYDVNDLNEILKNFAAINLNPVPLARRNSSKECSLKSIPYLLGISLKEE